jgi:urease accessory protein
VPEFHGHLSLGAGTRPHGRTVLLHQSFRAPFHLSKPYWDADSRALLVQVVNPTAGILAGDRLQSEIRVDRDAALIVTTPSASRVFQMHRGQAECQQHFHVAAGAWLEVMPEPLVPHRGSCYRQSTHIEVEAGGSMFFVDQLMPGRVGHGEAWAWQRLCLELNVRIGGALALRERWDRSGDALRATAEFMGSGPTACFANAVLIAPASEDAGSTNWKAALNALHGDGLWLGISALRVGGWSLKLVARDALQLRQSIRDVRRVLAGYFPRLGCDLRKL